MGPAGTLLPWGIPSPMTFIKFPLFKILGLGEGKTRVQRGIVPPWGSVAQHIFHFELIVLGQEH